MCEFLADKVKGSVYGLDCAVLDGRVAAYVSTWLTYFLVVIIIHYYYGGVTSGSKAKQRYS